MYIRKEAVLSSMIEGTQSSLSDLLIHELSEQPGVPLDDVNEVSNYVAALEYGLRRIDEGFPISLRLIREIHEILLHKGRGGSQDPGQFRRSQNRIGGTRPSNAVFVPPPPEHVLECMSALERFIHDENGAATSALQKAALAHVQFETIHPFLDGNGRLGRLLITLILVGQKVIREPTLYLSYYFKSHRSQYYELLNRVREHGDWESWLMFFAEAVTKTAEQAVETTQQLLKRADEDIVKIQTLKSAASSALRVHRSLTEHPIASAKSLADKTGLSPATVNKCLVHLETLGIVRNLAGRKRHRLFKYTEYIEILNQGTDLPE